MEGYLGICLCKQEFFARNYCHERCMYVESGKRNRNTLNLLSVRQRETSPELYSKNRTGKVALGDHKWSL